MNPTLEKPGHRALRAGRTSERNRAYLLTTVTHNRAPLFMQWQPAAAMSQLISCPETWPGGQLVCWVLMPDHWHGLLLINGSQSIPQMMNRAKGRSACLFNRATGRTGAVWAKSFHDRAIRRDEDLVAVARYVVANPVRAGLVKSVGMYSFWDACWLGFAGDELVFPVADGVRA